MKNSIQGFMSAAKIALKTFLPRSGKASLWMAWRAGVFDVAPDPPGHEEGARDADQKIEAVEPGL